MDGEKVQGRSSSLACALVQSEPSVLSICKDSRFLVRLLHRGRVFAMGYLSCLNNAVFWTEETVGIFRVVASLFITSIITSFNTSFRNISSHLIWFRIMDSSMFGFDRITLSRIDAFSSSESVWLIGRPGLVRPYFGHYFPRQADVDTDFSPLCSPAQSSPEIDPEDGHSSDTAFPDRIVSCYLCISSVLGLPRCRS